MDLPPCPVCRSGRLLPLSTLHYPLAYWVCSTPDCTYVVSGSAGAVTFHKGHALVEEKAKGDKEWVQFNF